MGGGEGREGRGGGGRVSSVGIGTCRWVSEQWRERKGGQKECNCTHPSKDSSSEPQFLLSSNPPLSISHPLPLAVAQRGLQGDGWQARRKLSLVKIQLHCNSHTTVQKSTKGILVPQSINRSYMQCFFQNMVRDHITEKRAINLIKGAN